MRPFQGALPYTETPSYGLGLRAHLQEHGTDEVASLQELQVDVHVEGHLPPALQLLLLWCLLLQRIDPNDPLRILKVNHICAFEENIRKGCGGRADTDWMSGVELCTCKASNPYHIYLLPIFDSTLQDAKSHDAKLPIPPRLHSKVESDNLSMISEMIVFPCSLSRVCTWYRDMDMPCARSSLTRPEEYSSERQLCASCTRPARKAQRPSCAMVRLYKICVLVSMFCTLSCGRRGGTEWLSRCLNQKTAKYRATISVRRRFVGREGGGMKMRVQKTKPVYKS